MGTELVLLSDVEVTPDRVIHACQHAHPEGTYVAYSGGDIGQLLAEDATPLLTVFRSRPVPHAREAAAAVVDPPASFALWTDVILPYSDRGAGRAAAESIAAAVGGVIKERA
jgi:hypothetical protein